MTDVTSRAVPSRAASLAAEAAFRSILGTQGAILLEPVWLGSKKPHRIRCGAGHERSVRPGNVLCGRGICGICSSRDPATSEARFRSAMAALGATPLFGAYLGKDHPHPVRCAEGHLCNPRPSHLRRGGGVCAACARNDPATAEAGFLGRLRELGASPAYELWRGTGQPHRVICAEGHECWPWPTSVQQGRGACRVCANQDPATAAGAFRARLAAIGATLIDTEWRGANHTYRIRCAAGHECRPRPGDVQRGQGICRYCAGKDWDAFYVVTSPLAVKFGITSGDGAHRLRVHAATGYRTVVRCVTGLPGDLAPGTENAVKVALAMAREQPVRGREYFDISCLALILDVADGWLASGARLPA